MSKKHKGVHFGPESLLRLFVFVVLVSLAIGYLSNAKSSITIPNLDPKILGTVSPQIEQGQKYIENQILKLKEQAIDQAFEKIKSTFLK